MTTLTFWTVRSSRLAGMWYPARADALRQSVDRFLHSAEATASEPAVPNIRGVLAPHAGHRYSGPVAGHAFAHVRNLPVDTVVVIGPLHYPLPEVPVSAGILTTGHRAYETPLGDVPVDVDSLQALAKHIPMMQVLDDPEHSIEIELPFLQQVLKPGFRLVPIMLRDQRVETARLIGSILADVFKDRPTLLVASSDLSHFYPQDVAQRYDHKMLDSVTAMNAVQVIEYDERGIAFACGCGAIAAVLFALKAIATASTANVLNYATSGDVNGDYARVVGYGAAAFSAS